MTEIHLFCVVFCLLNASWDCNYSIFVFLTDLGACAITAIPFKKSKVLFSLEETDDFVLVDETEPSISTEHVPEHTPDHARSGASPEKWGWIMFECGIENLTVKGIMRM